MGMVEYGKEESVIKMENPESKKNMVTYVTYGDEEIEIVKKGIAAIQEVLMGSDTGKKRSLLFALDWFMDPYYHQAHYIADFRGELIDLLQTVIITSDDDEVSDDALQLLSDYEWPPFEILEKNIDKVSEQMKPYVLEFINYSYMEYGKGDSAIKMENLKSQKSIRALKYDGSVVTYGDEEKEIVKKGIAAIQEVLMGSDIGKKRSLLCALDWFMDPYSHQDHYIADFRGELIDLLQTVIITSDDEASYDALFFLSYNIHPPFEILEKNIDKVSEQMKPYVLEVINNSYYKESSEVLSK